MRKSLFAAAAVLAMAGLVWAAGRPGVVRTKDGGAFDGLVDEKEETVVVNVHGIDTTIARDNILSISYGDFESRWSEAYGKLEKTDEAGRITAARKAFEEHRYDLAEKALRDTLAINPNNAEAAEMLKLTINQRRMERTAGANSTGEQPAATPSTPGTAPVKTPGQWNTLTPAEISHVKQLEVRPDDGKVRFGFDNNVRKKYYDANPQLATQYHTYNDFIKESQSVQAEMIIKDGGDMAKDVRVVNDPEVIVTFRKNVLPLVLQGCATSLCHGGNDQAAISKFALISPAADNAAVYTDFYVLTTTKVNANKGVIANVTSGGPDWQYMVDRTHPSDSLVLQYGLPDSMADKKHPHVAGYNGVFTKGKTDPKYAAIANWVQSLSPIAPDYGISFKLERNAPAAAAPTTTPSTQPAGGAAGGAGQ